MKNKEYLNEEENQRISKKLSTISKVMMICGGISFMACSILQFGGLIPFEISGLIGFLWIISFAVVGFGLVMFFAANQRKISAYMVQQQMPVAKEGIKKVAPTVGKVAKEVTKGIKKGLKEEDK